MAATLTRYFKVAALGALLGGLALASKTLLPALAPLRQLLGSGVGGAASVVQACASKLDTWATALK